MDQNALEEIKNFDIQKIIPPIQQFGTETYKATVESLFFNGQNQKALIQSNIAVQNHETLRQLNHNKYQNEDHLLLALRSFQPEEYIYQNQQIEDQLDSQQIQQPYLQFKIPYNLLPNLQKFAKTYQFLNEMYQIFNKLFASNILKSIFSFPPYLDLFIFEVNTETFNRLKNNKDFTKNQIIEDIIIETQDMREFLERQQDYRPRLQIPLEQGYFQIVVYQNFSDKVTSIRNDLNQTHIINEDNLTLIQDNQSQSRFTPATSYLNLYKDENALNFIKYFSHKNNLQNAQNFNYVQKYFSYREINDPLTILVDCLEYIEKAKNIFLWEQIIQNYYQNYQKSVMQNDPNKIKQKISYFNVLQQLYTTYNEKLIKQTNQKQFKGILFNEGTFDQYCKKRLNNQNDLSDIEKDSVIFDWRDKNITLFLIADQIYYIGVVETREQTNLFQVEQSSLGQQLIDLDMNLKRVYIFIKDNTQLFETLTKYKAEKFEQIDSLKQLLGISYLLSIDQIFLEQAYKVLLQTQKNRIISEVEKKNVYEKIEIHVNMINNQA